MRDTSRRDTLTILADLLGNMKEPKRLTHLLYASNLSYSQLIKYLKMITEMGLAEERKKPFHSYIITDDGKFFIDMASKRKKSTPIIQKITKSI